MRRLTRSAAPVGLASAHSAELAKARKYFITDGKVKGFAFKAYKTKGITEALGAFSNKKCAYCEAEYDVTQPLDVEHYRPKGAVETDAGVQHPAYWWLGGDWDNLLPSCIRCNRAEYQLLYDGTMQKVGKGNRFPLIVEANRASTEGDHVHEEPLLIDPSREDPALFIKFVLEDGHSIAKPVDETELSVDGRRARASINIYGLNREALVRSRSRYVTRALASVIQLGRLMTEYDSNPTENQKSAVAHEVQILQNLVNGEDLFTGTIRSAIHPLLTEIGVSLPP